MIFQLVLCKIYPNLQYDYFNSSHSYELRYVSKPLFCEQIGFFTRVIGATHVGLAAIDEQTGAKMVIQYEVDPLNYTFRFIDVMRPRRIFNETTKLYDLQWDLKTRVYWEDDWKLGECGWEGQVVISTHVNGSILNAMTRDYAQWYMDFVKYYQLMEIRYADTRERYADIHSYSCHDFVWWAMQDLEERGVVFNGKMAHRNYLWWQIDRVHKGPRKLDAHNAADNKLLVEWYDAIGNITGSYRTEAQLGVAYLSGEINKRMQSKWPDFRFIAVAENEYWAGVTNELLIWFELKDYPVPGVD